MSVTVEGLYKAGKIELLETPKGLKEGRVRVTLVEEARPSAQYLVYGKYSSGKMSELKDFQTAEWRGEAEFDEQNDK